MEERALTTGEIIGLATEKVNLGRRLVNDLKDLLHIPGVQRMQKQISSQTNVLLSAINDGSISVLQINSSKLLHLECLVKILRKCRAITSVDYVLPLRESEADPMRMDVVCENGTCTVNVEAKNLHTLSNSLNEAASTGHQRIVNQAEEFVEAATNNAEGEGPIPPQVCLIFDNELENGGAKGVDENSLMDFVNSIVHTNIAEPVDKSWEFQTSPGKEQKTRDQREYKRIQMQQRRANPIIRTADNDRKREIKSDNRDEEGLDPPRKFIRADGTLTEEQLTPGDVEDPQFKPEVGVYEVVQAETDTVVVAPEETYNTSQSYFCENCKAYEQEILRLREQLKRKDNLIKSLEASQAPLNAE